MAKSKKSVVSGSGGGDAGYRKPPKSGQFKPGRSGNPGGRKKGSQNLRTIYAQVYGEMRELTVDGKKRVISGLQAMIMREFQLGMSGDGRVIWRALNRIERFQKDESAQGPEETSEDDRAIIERAIRRRDKDPSFGSDQPTDAAPDEGAPDVDDADADADV